MLIYIEPAEPAEPAELLHPYTIHLIPLNSIIIKSGYIPTP